MLHLQTYQINKWQILYYINPVNMLMNIFIPAFFKTPIKFNMYKCSKEFLTQPYTCR